MRRPACHQDATSQIISDSNTTSCPFTIDRLNTTTYLIREKDDFGEFPHIYAKLCYCQGINGPSKSILVITDTGVGTTVPNSSVSQGPPVWTICSFLEHTINPNHQLPYLVITSHCHYDHILGIGHFLNQPLPKPYKDSNFSFKILSSSHKPSFILPWTTLNHHSLCDILDQVAPHYKIDIWAKDHEQITYTDDLSNTTLITPIITLHTPGHTPDSLAWYDAEERALYTGDSLYYEQSPQTLYSPWGSEPPASIEFTIEADMRDWWDSMEKLIEFVQAKNVDQTTAGTCRNQVKLFAGHVTAGADAEVCLRGAKAFMARVLRGDGDVVQAPFDEFQGHARARWSDAPRGSSECVEEVFSVIAPVEVIKRGRKTVSKVECAAQIEFSSHTHEMSSDWGWRAVWRDD